MAEIAEGGGGGHAKNGKKRAKKQSTKIDMTPMVDLAFLLLTFFVMTSTFSKAKVMSLVYPAKPDEKKEQVDQPPIFNAVTFLVTEDKLFYYEGEFYAPGNPKGKPATTLSETDFGPNGVRKMLAEGNRYVIEGKKGLDERLAKGQIVDSIYKQELIKLKKSNDALKVLIKTDEKATCKNFIDLIDELKIANIGVVAPVDIMQSEMDLLKAKIN